MSMNDNKGLEALAALASATSERAASTAVASEGVSTSLDGGAASSTVSAALELAVATHQKQLQPSSAASSQHHLGNHGAAPAASSLTPNQLALLAAAGLGAAPLPPQQTHSVAASATTDPKVLLAMQNLAYYQMLQLQQGNKQQQQPAPQQDHNQALAAALVGRSGLIQSKQGLPCVADAAVKAAVVANIAAKMPPPSNVVQHVQPTTTAGRLQPPAIAPSPDQEISRSGAAAGGFAESMHSKKQHKRAANRRSAQLSRKRKKQFVEELKEENDDLRRKEQILMSIPDLVVVFDSSGKLWFVSQSVERFLSFSSDELRGTSFWERICEDSMRLIKAAFMDSLAARTADSDTAPLGNGLWELQLVDRDGSQKIVTLNGVVHFAGDRPECVCSMRPVEDDSTSKSNKNDMRSGVTAVTMSTMATTKTGSSNASSVAAAMMNSSSPLCVDPRQSVIREHMLKNNSNGTQAVASSRGGTVVRISDSGNSTGEGSCESGSSDELTGAA